MGFALLDPDRSWATRYYDRCWVCIHGNYIRKQHSNNCLIAFPFSTGTADTMPVQLSWTVKSCACVPSFTSPTTETSAKCDFSPRGIALDMWRTTTSHLTFRSTKDPVMSQLEMLSSPLSTRPWLRRPARNSSRLTALISPCESQLSPPNLLY